MRRHFQRRRSAQQRLDRDPCTSRSSLSRLDRRARLPVNLAPPVLMQYITPWAFIMPPDFSQAARFRRIGRAASDPTTRAVLGAE